MKEQKKRKYPKNRKSRDSSYSMTWKLIDKYGLDYIKSVWTQHGMYKTSYKLGVSPYVIRYIAHREKWTRPAELVPVILKGVLAGNVSPQFYKSLDFSGINLNVKKEDLKK